MADNSSTGVMSDFVFGGIESDDSHLLASEREQWSSLRHRNQIDPLDPLPGQPVTISVYAGPDVAIDRLCAYVTVDGSPPGGERGVATRGHAVQLEGTDLIWQPLLWDYVEVWTATFDAQPEGTFVQYRIEGWREEDPAPIWCSEANLDGTPARAALYGYHVDRFCAPGWAREALVYQIFVDRFSAYGQGWLEPDELDKVAGGTLRGVIEHLDYLVDLGVTVLWLSPVFRSYSSHGYDTIDYFSIDPRFGHEADLHMLVQEAHRHGLRVILDLVLNHTSTDFPLFSSALQNEASPYRQWFSFDPVYRHGYRTFFGVASMPQIDLDYPDARAYMLDVGRYWLREFDVDGYRLDYAAGPSHGFWSAFRAACRSAKPDCWIFGEVTRTGEPLRTYVGRLDGCLDFAFGRDARRLCATVEPSFGIGQFAQSLIRRRCFFGADFVLPAFLDNHDMNRFLWVVENDKERLKLAAGLLFAFGGTPIIYYGTEVGLSQPRPKAPYREESRHPMPWDEGQDVELLAFFSAWIALRKRHPALIYGDLSTHLLDEERGIWLVERCHAEDRVLVVVNCAGVGHVIALPEGDYMAVDGRPVSARFDCPPRSVIALSRPVFVSADPVDDIID